MNSGCHRLVFSKSRGMVVAVAETAIANGSAGRVKTKSSGPSRRIAKRVMRHAALAALTLLGLSPALSIAQIVPSGAHAPGVISTANGLPQVNIQKPSGASVSLNTYSQFDVSRSGAILNNSSVITSTQLAGQISGNPNFGANDAAKIIVNQVNSNNPSQLRGYIEVAGKKADVVVANPSGIVVDGGGFINTSRGILTTGNPLFDANGNLTGFNVTQGNIAVQGDGFNASNLDQVDLIARAVQVNAALYANKLNVVTGANNVDYASLNSTPTTGTGTVPSVSIDVAQLGGMYANTILLTSNEYGVGVNNAGVIEAQAGDLTLTSAGQLVQSGKMSASGNLAINAASVANSGTAYAQGTTTVSTSGVLSSTGTLAAQSDLNLNAGSVESSGVLAAALDSSGNLTGSGSLKVVSAGSLAATGTNAATGQVTLYGVSLNLAGSQTSAGSALALTATGGNLALTGATAGAGTIFTASAAGTLDTSGAQIGSGGNTQLSGAQITNNGGQVAAGGTLNVQTAGALANQQGSLQAAGAASVKAGSVDNTAGHIVSLDTEGLTLDATGKVLNASSGVIGGNGDVSISAGTLQNAATVSAQGDATLKAQTLGNDGGTATAGGNLSAQATGALTNVGGALGATGTATVSGASIDNTSGQISAAQVSVATPGNLVNRSGKIVQTGTADQTISAGGTLDDTGGTIATNAQDLTVAAQAVTNDGGHVQHAGTGTLTVQTPGALSNNAGQIITNGALKVVAASLDDTAGALAAQKAASITATNGIVNANGGELYGGASLAVSTQGVFNNAAGVVQSAGNLSLNAGGALLNAGGQIGTTGTGNVASTLDVSAASIDSTAGSVINAATGQTTVGSAGAIVATNGVVGGNGDLAVSAATLSGGGTYSAASDVSVNLQGNFTTSPNFDFSAGHNLTFTLPGTFSNAGALQATNNLNVNAADIQNSGAMMAGGTLATQSKTLENSGVMVGSSVSLAATQSIQNVGPSALIGATGSGGTLELLAPDIENRDDTTMTDAQATTAIYGLGSVVLAGGKDASGNYTNANLIRNQSGLIQSAGDMLLAANQVTNTRTTMTTTGFNQAVSSDVLTQLGISLSGCTSVVAEACDAGHPFVGWVPVSNPVFLTMIGGAPVAPPSGGQWNSGYQYTIYTGVALGNLIATISPQAQIVAGGNLDASRVNLFQNYWSAVTAAGNIAAPVALDQDSWQGQAAPEVQVTYSGYYHYTNYDQSIRDWSLPFGDAPFVGSNPGGYQVAPADIRYYTLPSYESTFVAGGSLSGTGVSINNTAANAGVPSLGLAPGQSLAVSSANGGVQVDPAIARATAQNVLNNLTLPKGGLFSVDTAPGAQYLVETNPAFTSQQSYISSDYYLQQLGLDPQNTEKRLGDALYEQQLVQNQITSLTGKAVLGPYTDTQSMYEALLASGASLAQSLDLPLGTGLSASQVAALTSNVVIMKTEVVDGQSVLVPVVYLAQASQQNVDGPLIGATDIDLQNAQTFTNSGTVQASNSLTVSGQSINNMFGTLQSGGVMSLATTGDVDLTSATVNAGSLALNAGGNLLLNTAANTVNQVSATGATRTTTTLGPVASVNVAGNAAIVTGGNFEQNGANLNVGGDLGVSVGGSYDIGSVQTGEQKVTKGANGQSDTNINNTTGSSIKVGGVSQIGVGGDLTATGANINLGDGGTIVAGGDVTLQAAKATTTLAENSSGSDSHGSYSESHNSSDDVLTGTTLNAGNSLTVAAGKDINVIGSSVNLDQGTATLAAAGDVNIGSATETHIANSQEEHQHSEVVSGKQVKSSSASTTVLNQGSTISADAVSISSGNDINVAGSTIVGTNDVSLAATHDVNITTTQDTSQTSTTYQEKRTGLGTSGLTLTVGTNKLATTDNESSTTNNGSVVGSLDGNLSIQAGSTLHVTGSDLVAAKDVTGTAANVIIDAATDTAHSAHTQETSSSGLTLGLGGSVGDAINNAYAQTQAVASGNSNGRAEALHAIAAVGDGLIGAASLMGGSLGGSSPSISIQLSLGSSKSQSQSSEDQVTLRGSSAQAGGTATFVATGDGTAGSGNLTIAGSNVSAQDVLLAAKNQVNIVNTTNTDVTQSTNKSSSASVGVSYGTQGFGVSASMSNAHGDANSNAAIQNASNVTGTNSVTVVSGGDTNIIGSQVNGGQVSASVGGNLNIQSVQDTTVSTAHQSSTGGGFSISQGGGSASFSAQSGHADSNYAQVNEQAGINAGSGGFNINVAGNTALTGAVITSTADASQNSLTTGTLTYADIQNQSHYSASSNGISAGVGVGSTGKAVGPGSVSGTGGVSPMISQDENGDSSATTRSAISAGAINITNQAAQTQDVAGLSRDTTNTNGTVSNTPDVNNLLSQQADTMQAAQAAGQVVSQGIGAYADSKRDAAVAQAKVDAANGDTAAVAADTALANQWMEGGDARAELQAVGGALIGGLGGGSVFTAAGGALGAGLSSKLADQTKAAADAVTDATGSSLLGNISGNVLAGLGGALVGGTAGAATASNVDLYNQNNDKGNEKAKSDLAAAQSQASFVQYAKAFGQAMLNVVPGKQMADQAQTAFANGNYGTAAALAVGSIGDAALGVLTGGEGKAVTSAVEAVEAAVTRTVSDSISTSPATLYHYTNEAAMNAILESEALNPSLKALNPNDVRYGNGQYLSDIPPGTMTPAQLSRAFVNNPFQGARYSNFVAVDVTGLNVVQGRPGVYVVPNEIPLDISGRITGSGAVTKK
ncbi:two-partner secretion domain-containing protein [Paraburkholderia tropica]|uniref:two-partner secretion domain-containing protein n=2 Tax=Paraburkholderia tropica TaxID=92647 RepID=UPI0038CD8BD9